MISCYRLSSRRYASATGKGAAQYGGRWNPVGIEAIYASTTASLAALEVLVHFSVLPRNYVLTEIQMPAGIKIESIGIDDLPKGWKAPSPVQATQELGRRWAVELRSAVLSVPSSILPTERNYVINPLHRDFARIRFLAPTRFQFDPRLK